ncbi:hypothetical protein LTR15_005839 [Elasticomyces elasticus]|nr:hypothetical protein LTR15_005839 [Elasticomyces elasticus]
MEWSRVESLVPLHLQALDPRAEKVALKRKRRPKASTQRALVPIANRPIAPKQGYVGLIAQNEDSEPAPPPIYRMSSSGDALLGAELVQTLSNLHLNDSWYSFVPSMLGDSVAADAAAKAVVKAHEFCATKGTPTGVARCDSSYLAALNTLRASLDVSDSALVAVGLLYLYEGIMKDQPTAYFSHAGGISAILLARPRTAPVTALTRAVLYGNTHGTFQQPLLQGTASPFDDPYWLDFEPATTYNLTASAVKLRKYANQSTIRLPGLIAKVRSIREASVPNRKLFLDSTRVALEILAMTDQSAENELLHRVTLKETKDIFDKAIFRYSFEFKSLYEKETLLLYWGNRLMILKLCLELHHLGVLADGSSCTAFKAGDLDDESERVVMSILMCWQDGLGFVNPLSMVWGALMGKITFRGRSVEPVRSWVWTRYHDSLTGWPITYTMAEMDEESEELVGGPLTGQIAKQDMGDQKKKSVG